CRCREVQLISPRLASRRFNPQQVIKIAADAAWGGLEELFCNWRNYVSDDIRRHFRLLADYNRAANSQLYQACGKVPPSRLDEPSSAPYSTILGLLEHLIASDHVWLSRFEGDARAQLEEDH